MQRNNEAPEYKSVLTFAKYLDDEERTSYTVAELIELNYRTHIPMDRINKDLEVLGFSMEKREPAKRVRGFTTSSHDRYYGPGSAPSHGGTGF